jgi:hypothetical protein
MTKPVIFKSNNMAYASYPSLELKETPILSYVMDVAIPVLKLEREERNISDPRVDGECLVDCHPGWFSLGVDVRASYGTDNTCVRGIPCNHGDEVTLMYGRSLEDFFHNNNPRAVNACYEGRKLEELLNDPAIFTESLSVLHSHLQCGHEHGFTMRSIRLGFAHNVLKDYDMWGLRKEKCCSNGNRYVFDYYSGPLEKFIQPGRPSVKMSGFPGLGKASQVIEEFMKVAAGRKLSDEQLAELSKDKDVIDSIKWKSE